MNGRGKRATWAFTVMVALLAGAGTLVTWGISGIETRPFEIGWLLLAVAFAASERFPVELELRSEAQSLTFSELPLVLGLLFAEPQTVIIARLAGAGFSLIFFRKMPFVKIAFNLSIFVIEVTAAIVLFHAILGEAEPTEPVGWLAAIAGVGASHVLGWALVSCVIFLAGAPVTLRSTLNVLLVSSASALAATCVAISAGAVLWRDGHAWILLLLVGGALGYFFISFVRIRDRHQALAALHEFTTMLSGAETATALNRAVVSGIAALLKAARVVVLIPTHHGVVKVEFVEGDFAVDRAHDVTDLDWMSAVRGSAVSHRGSSIAGVELAHAQAITCPLPLPDNPGLVLVDGRLSEVRNFDHEDVQLLETAAVHAAAAVHNAQLVNELREEASYRARQALRDEVTDLPNSRGLAEDLARSLAIRQRLVVLTVRIDSLREVNETLGRSMGDELLHQIAARLGPLGHEPWCAKTASDEFTLVIPGGPDEADMLANRVIAAFDQPVSCGEVALAVNAGIGVALAPEHGSETEILLRRASLAASRCKVEGTKVTTWAADRDPYDPQRLAIAADLRDAIPRGELQVHFQPQVDIASGLVTGAEALVRWNHPRLGELRPDQFIAAAEYTGAIDALTAHVLEVAATTCARWRAQGWDLEVSVNVSARNLSNPNFAGQVEQIVHQTGLDPSGLTLELTESSVMTEAESAIATLDRLAELGLSWSIDDFGTGYSSLAHLRRLPVSEIKIDKSFVFDLTTNQSDEAIVRSMIELGRNLGMTVVVEGVETVEVRRRLDELGADRIQGYLLSRPMSSDAFEQWIADRPVRMASFDDRESVGDEYGIDPR